VYLDQIVYFPLEIARLLTTYKQAGVSVGRLEEAVGGAAPERLISHERIGAAEVALPRSRVRESLRELRVEGLVCRYPGAERAVGPIDLTLRAGTVTVLAGRIGAGKSTLVQALLGLVPIERGRILWNGVPIDPGKGELAHLAAYTPQVPHLFSESVRDNVLAGTEDDGERLARAIHAAVLERDVPQLERGLDTLVGPRGVRLSGGQIQRTAAARMFARGAQLFVLDDLSSALDVETEQTLWDRLYARRAADDSPNATYLVISHRPAALERADRVVTLEDGKVVSDT
ncbi:MAG TPA: ABC transporter ATP-binding protein, partial [Chloroflexota bacterium]|nr:ABC transporter ATP-binding protein [Chloroflexota bacterium]